MRCMIRKILFVFFCMYFLLQDFVSRSSLTWHTASRDFQTAVCSLFVAFVKFFEPEPVRFQRYQSQLKLLRNFRWKLHRSKVFRLYLLCILRLLNGHSVFLAHSEVKWELFLVTKSVGEKQKSSLKLFQKEICKFQHLRKSLSSTL